MRILKWFLIAIVITPITILVHSWLTGSAYMKRPPEVDVRSLVPTGLRTSGHPGGEKLKLSQYRSAGVTTISLAKNLNLIIEELGVDYLNDLRSFQGKGDGYEAWEETPIDVATLQRTVPLVAALLASYQKKCDSLASNKQRSTYCRTFRDAESRTGIFYTYSQNEFLLVDAKFAELQIAFTGPLTENR